MYGHSSMRRDNTKYYQVLGVSKSASRDEIKKAYKKSAIINHPDKGGDPEKFKELAQAYEVLGNPNKRELYDLYGEDEEAGFSGPTQNPFDIFESFFGAGVFDGFSSSIMKKEKGEDIFQKLEVSLEEVYNGAKKSISFTKQTLCSTCKGMGTKSGKSASCHGCNGSGLRIVSWRNGPGNVQKMKYVCPDCKGAGELINGLDRCKKCTGRKVTISKRTVEVEIKKGMEHDQSIVIQHEGKEAPDTLPGDLVVELQVNRHSIFKRDGDDLHLEHSLTLTEALCGFLFVINHLDGRRLIIKSNPGEVIKPDTSKVINGEGMPNFYAPNVKGRVFVHFTVDFPESGFLSSEQSKVLETILPLSASNLMSDITLENCEQPTMHDVDIEKEMMEKTEDYPLEYTDDEYDYCDDDVVVVVDDDDDDDDDDGHAEEEEDLYRMACNQQ